MKKLFNRAYDIFLNSKQKGEWECTSKPILRRFLRGNNIKYEKFIEFCKYSKKDFRKFLILVYQYSICEKSFELSKRSLFMIIKKKYPKHIKKTHVKQSYPIILYYLGAYIEHYKEDKKELMLKYYKESGKFGFKKSIIQLNRSLEKNEEKNY